VGIGLRAAQKVENFHFLVESPRRSEPFNRLLKLLGLFMRPTTVHWCFAFVMIRFTGHGVTVQKPARWSFNPIFFSVHTVGKAMRWIENDYDTV